MSPLSQKDSLSRADFLRLSMLGAGGLGVAALAGCQARTVVTEEERQGYVVAITHGPDDPRRVMLALATASFLPQGDNHVWFAIDGGEICNKEIAEQVSSEMFPEQGTAAEMLDKLRDDGIAVHIWPSCADYFGIEGAVALEGLDRQGLDWLLEKVATHHLVWL